NIVEMMQARRHLQRAQSVETLPSEDSMRRIFLVGVASIGTIALAACGGGGNSGGTVQTIAVSAMAAAATVAVGQTDQFTAAVTGTSDTAVTWAVMGGAANGTISPTGLYTAPANVPNPATVTVTATSQANSSKSGSATITVTPNVTVSVSAPSSTVGVF